MFFLGAVFFSLIQIHPDLKNESFFFLFLVHCHLLQVADHDEEDSIDRVIRT